LKSLPKLGIYQKRDERILGYGDFVEKLIEEADERMKCQYSRDTQRKLAVKLIRKVSEKD